LQQVQRQTGKTPKELESPPFPTLVSHIWSAFIALSSARTNGYNGPNPLTYTDIKAWAELTNSYVSSRDVEAIKLLDTVFIRTQNG